MTKIQKMLKRFSKKPIQPQPELNSLPDLCLLSVFSHLTLLELLRAKQVCNRWRFLAESVCSRYRSLTILIGGEELLNNSFFTIPYLSLICTKPQSNERHQDLFIDIHKHHLVAGTFRWLVSTFPRISCLTFVLDQHVNRPYFSIKQLLYLLTSWNSKLVSLTLHLRFSKEMYGPLRHHLADQLIQTINFLPKLKCLTLDLNDSYSQIFSNEIELKILIRLEEFHFSSSDNLSEIIFLYKSIQRFTKLNPNLQRVSVGNSRFLVPNFQISNLEHFAQKLVHLNITLNVRNCLKIRHFSNLACLKLTLASDANLALLCQALSPLQNLIYLHLNIDCNNRLPLSNEDTILSEFARVFSVKLLTFELTNNANHLTVLSRKFAWIFPNLEVLEFSVETLLCKACAQSIVDRNQPNGNQNYLNDHCIRRMARSFRKCHKLSGIFVRYINTNIVFRFK